jgi:hypothetical protein
VELEQVIQNIRLLTRKTVSKGCTEAEAMAAATKIGELMRVYNLSMDRIFLNDAKCITRGISTGRNRRHPIDKCLIAIAEFCDCKVWFDKSDAISKYNFFGLEPDTEMATYLYTTILGSIERETDTFKETNIYTDATCHRKRLSVSFQKGMVRRINDRLQEMTTKRKHQEDIEIPKITTDNGTTSLMVIKYSKVEDEYAKLSLHLRKTYNQSRCVNMSAYNEGVQRGNSVNLSRPIQRGCIAGLLT